MRTRRSSRTLASVALMGAIVGILWADGHYTAALAVLSALCFVLVAARLLASRAPERGLADSEFALLHDPLTELPNRLLFHDRVHQAILGATRTGTRAAVIVLDVDRFQEINETLGHHMGDLLLYELGYRLTETLRQSDSVARLGGDEFAILLPEVEDEADA
ncbi:MAG TPA: GGDEF domain-containing protein, partial [Thermoleophilaceae bacterium]|nr:GGDEF domain-containing protein [Thermoleophilaceae bacterium]